MIPKHPPEVDFGIGLSPIFLPMYPAFQEEPVARTQAKSFQMILVPQAMMAHVLLRDGLTLIPSRFML